MKYNTISGKHFFPAKGAIYYVAIATVIFSHVKITYYFHMWRYQIFTWKLAWYFIGVYIIKIIFLSSKSIAGPESTLSHEKFQFSFILFLKNFHFSVSPSYQNFLWTSLKFSLNFNENFMWIPFVQTHVNDTSFKLSQPFFNKWNWSVAWNSSNCFELFSPLNNLLLRE